jgi:hypothetical protein
MGWALQHLKDAYFAGLPAYVRRRLQGEIEGGNAVKRRFRPVEEAELVTCPNCFGQVVVKGVCVKCGIAGLGAWTANPFRPSAGLVGMDELDYELRDLKKYPRPETDARARFELLLGFIAADPCLIRIALRLLEDPAITFTEARESAFPVTSFGSCGEHSQNPRGRKAQTRFWRDDSSLKLRIHRGVQ